MRTGEIFRAEIFAKANTPAETRRIPPFSVSIRVALWRVCGKRVTGKTRACCTVHTCETVRLTRRLRSVHLLSPIDPLYVKQATASDCPVVMLP
jgi:hypothetical protein